MQISSEERIRTVTRTTVINASINLLLATLKILIGFTGKSQALIADGVHSLSDLITDGLVFLAAKAGSQQPDKDHPYGHQRIETFATIIMALILTSVAIGIAYETLSHVLLKTPTETPSQLVIVVAIISIIANEFLYRYTMMQGNKIDSPLLRSNAWHNRSDALVSVIVVISATGAMLGAYYLDTIGALLIAALILKMAIKMIWTSVKELVDTAVEDALVDDISQKILDIDGITAIHQLRTRRYGQSILLDVHIEVASCISISEGHYISEQVNRHLTEIFPQIIDITTHIDPENDETADNNHLPNRTSVESLLKKKWRPINSATEIKKIILHYLDGKISIEIYLPVEILAKQQKQQLLTDYQRSIEDLNDIDNVIIYFQ